MEVAAAAVYRNSLLLFNDGKRLTEAHDYARTRIYEYTP
jgi:hypothetical protein